MGGAAAAIFSGSGQSCVAGSRLLRSSAPSTTRSSSGSGSWRRPSGRATRWIPTCRWGRSRTEHSSSGSPAPAWSRPPPAPRRTSSPGERGWRGRASSTCTHAAPPGVSNTDDIAQREVFGPVVAAIPFDEEEEAVALADATEFGLAGAVWTGRADRGHRVAAALRAGTVWVNSYKYHQRMAPFGRLRERSGFGRSSGYDGLLEYSEPKAVWVETLTRRHRWRSGTEPGDRSCTAQLPIGCVGRRRNDVSGPSSEKECRRAAWSCGDRSCVRRSRN